MTKVLKKAWRLLAVVGVVICSMLPTWPVAAIANPDSIGFNSIGTGGTTTGYHFFQSVAQTGDWILITTQDVQYDPTPVPSEEVTTAFMLQILNTAGTAVLFSRPLYSYNYSVDSIYLTAAEVAALTWGSPYKVRICPNPALFGAGVEGTNQVTRTLVATDWVTGDLTTSPDLVKAYCLTIAAAMAVHDSATYTTTVVGGLALNSTGRDKFLPNPIPNLFQICPSLFQAATGNIVYTAPEGTGAYSTELNMATQLGATLNARFEGIGTYFGTSGQVVGALFMLMIALVLGGIVYGVTGSGAYVLVAMFPVIILGTWFGMIPMALLFGVAVIMAAYMAYHLYLRAI